MARYFIHIFDGTTVWDEDGEELASLSAARRTALRVMSEVAASRSERFWQDGSLKIVVQDEKGADVVILEMRDLTTV
jgi:hypothetical protein